MARPAINITSNLEDAILEASHSGVTIKTAATGPKVSAGKTIELEISQEVLAELMPRLLRAFASSIDLAKIHEF